MFEADSAKGPAGGGPVTVAQPGPSPNTVVLRTILAFLPGSVGSRSQFLGCFGLRLAVRFHSNTRVAAANVGMPWARCFSASGSPPSRASLQLATASASETSGTPALAEGVPGIETRPRRGGGR